MSTEITRVELKALLVERIAEFTELAEHDIDVDRPLDEYGLSSRQAVELSGELEDLLDEALSTTVLWEHPTIGRLVAALAGGSEAESPEQAAHPDGRILPAADEAIAVVGLGCRFPGGINGPAEFWEALCGARDAIGEVPGDRWSGFADNGGDTTRRGGFLDDIAGFDAEFFGIAPREAARMDPQQRMLLELAWESLEHAGIAPSALRGSDTGVFVGISGTEYGAQSLADMSGMDAWAGTGAALSIAANRLSYLLDLRGPSLSVDTACSSSLTALHLAATSLRAGESEMALVGGANLLLSPAVTANFDEMGITSPDGKCKPFSADADGIGRSEGAGMVVLKRLRDARADGDRVLAVIRGSASNSDGRSNGLTAPNPEAQRALLRSAYRQAGTDPAAVDYVEAHGTGTLLGDPIEARALAAVLSDGRPARRPLLLGSVKSNLGHLEAAAGIAGLIKVVLSLYHRAIPATLHYNSAHPHVDFAALGLAVVDDLRSWPDGAAVAGVSGFGFGGTNAHVVLERADADVGTGGQPEPNRYRLPLAAPNTRRLRARAARLAAWFDASGAERCPADVQRTLTRRLDGTCRGAVVGEDRAELVRGLRALAAEEPSPRVVTGARGEHATGPLFVFSGHGSQWTGMARQLLRDEPVFAAAVDRIDPLIATETGHSLREDIETCAEHSTMDRVQPLLFGIQLALVDLWRHYGIAPSAVLGHSFGEVTAAVVAGALSEADGARVLALRSRLLASVAGNGAMALLELGAVEVAQLISEQPGIDIAALSAPNQTVIAGQSEQVKHVVSEVDSRGLLAKLINLDVAAHSPIMDSVTGELAEPLSAISPGSVELDFYTTALADPREHPAFDAEYWARNLRNPVRFTGAVAAALEDGYHTFVEIAPHPILRHALTDNAAPLVVHTTRSDADEVTEFHRQLATIELAGHRAAPCGGELIDLPTVPWEHTRHWLPNPVSVSAGTHPLLGAHVEVPDSADHVFSADVGSIAVPWLSDHELDERAVLPAAAYAEMASAAMRTACGVEAERVAVHDLTMHQPLPLTEHTRVSTTLTPTGDAAAGIKIHTKDDGSWLLHATAEARLVELEPPEPRGETTRGADAESVSSTAIHARLREFGVRYGPTFNVLRGVRAATEGETGTVHATGELAPAHSVGRDSALRLDPVLLDSCLQVLAGALLSQDDTETGVAYLPMAFGAVRLYGAPSDCTTVHASVDSSAGAGGPIGQLSLVDLQGRVLLEVADVFLTRVDAGTFAAPLAEHLLEAHWEPAQLPAAAAGGDAESLLVCSSGVSPLAGAVAARAGAHTRHVDYHDTAELANAVTAAGLTSVAVVLPTAQAEGLRALAEAERAVLAVAATTRALTEDGDAATNPPRLCLITTGASTPDAGDAGQPAFAALRGLIRVLAYEHPELRAGIVDLDPTTGEEHNAATALAELRRGVDDEVAWRGETRNVLRLHRASLPANGAREPVARQDGGYVLTGGLGGLGLLLARWLAEQGAGKLVLNGRSEPSADAVTEIESIRATGTEIEVVRGDIGAPGTAETLVARADSGATLRGVLHAAATFDDRTTSMLEAETLSCTWRAKAYGAWHLHEATLGHDLDWWIGFSSAAALHGLPGQPAYASANAYLDALVASRRANGLAATSVSWGTWSQVGAAAGIDVPWMRPIAPDEALTVLHAAIAGNRSGLGALRLDLAGLTAAFPRITELGLFQPLLEEQPAEASPELEWAGMARVRELAPEAARAAVTGQLRARVSSVLGYTPEQLDTTAPLPALGVDSLLAVRIRNAVQHDFDCSLPVSLLLRGASVAEAEEWLCDTLELGAGPAMPARSDDVLIGPRDAAERLVASAWQDVLGSDVGVTQDFYAIGGSRKKAEEVTALLVERSGRELTVSELFELPSIERMAQHLREEEHGGSPLRVIREGGEKNPLFVFHPGGGDTAVYRQLVQLLDSEFPVYGFDRVEGLPDVEQRALHYLPQLREIQPHGPYRLAGWSFGGFIAYDMAQLLRRAGEDVEIVAMMDPILPLADESGLTEVQLLEKRFERFGEFLETSYGKRIELPYEQLARLDEEDQVQLLVDTMRAEGLINSAVSDAILHHQRTSFLDARALERYRPDPYDGRVLFFSAAEQVPGGLRDQRFDRTDPARGWDEVCGDLEVITVSGHHLSMLDPPNVDQIAKHLDKALTSRVVEAGGRSRVSR